MVASHINVHNTCLLILRKRGFELEIKGESEPDGSYPVERFYVARRNGFYYCDYNPIELLGLVAIHDFIQPKEDCSYWWRIEGPEI